MITSMMVFKSVFHEQKSSSAASSAIVLQIGAPKTSGYCAISRYGCAAGCIRLCCCRCGFNIHLNMSFATFLAASQASVQHAVRTCLCACGWQCRFADGNFTPGLDSLKQWLTVQPWIPPAGSFASLINDYCGFFEDRMAAAKRLVTFCAKMVCSSDVPWMP